jgi:hypothetical protein
MIGRGRSGGSTDVIGEPVRWPDEVDEVISGDLAAAVAYLTPAGGAVVTAVGTVGIGRRETGEVGFTTCPFTGTRSPRQRDGGVRG